MSGSRSVISHHATRLHHQGDASHRRRVRQRVLIHRHQISHFALLNSTDLRLQSQEASSFGGGPGQGQLGVKPGPCMSSISCTVTEVPPMGSPGG